MASETVYECVPEPRRLSLQRLEKIRTEIEHNDEKAEADYAAAQEGKKAQ